MNVNIKKNSKNIWTVGGIGNINLRCDKMESHVTNRQSSEEE
jgi:hypothetical protein